MKSLKYIAAIALLFGVSSCADFLDVIPKGKVIPKTTEDYDGMVKDPSHVSGIQPLPDVSGDNVEMPESYITGALNSSNGRAYLWMPAFFKDTEDDSGWVKPYAAIFTMNIVIERVMDSEGGTAETKNRVMAEAKINRAYYHWTILNQYAGAYDKNTASKDLGAPVMLKSDLEVKAVRATVERTLAAILDDLNIDPMWLPTTGEPGNKYRITRQALHAFKARVHFYMYNYDLAAEEATKALAINDKLEDFNTYSFKDPLKPTSGVNNMSVYIDSPEVLMYRGSSFGSMSSMFNISAHLESVYNMYPGDLRLTFGYSDIARDGKPTDDGKKRCIREFNPLIGVPEMMLIKAEALARKGDANALNLVNDLRKKRVATADYTDVTASGKDALLKIVLEERERELAYSGLRWFDMKRLGKEGIYTTTLTRTSGTTTRTLVPNSPLYAFPISPKITAINNGLIQNPRE